MRTRGHVRNALRAGAAMAVALAVAGCAATSVTSVPITPAPATPSSSTASTSVSPAVSVPPSASAGTGDASASPSASPAIPSFDHVYVIILENKEYNQIVGSRSAPYMNSLIAKYGLATSFFAETHPSEPNYIALTSGGLQGTDSDGTYNLNVPNLFDQVEASGRTWRVYAQGYPGGCFKPYAANAVTDGPGQAGDYVRKHNPAMSYTSISGNPTRCANIVALAGFDPGAANFELIIPNEINDMHSSSVAAGDNFLRVFVPSIVNSPAFANSALFITFDEGDTNESGGGHIPTIVASPGMTPGSRFTQPTNHYGLLRTIEQAWGLPFLGKAATATAIDIGY